MDIVIGSQYGDEGKGMTVDWLVRKRMELHDGKAPIVVRFSGGHQCGHRVVHHDKEHIFSNFGSGTLRGAATYWTKECTIDPVGFMREYKILGEKGIIPTIFADPECPITTPYDKIHNHLSEKIQHHGSTGVGFGATIARNEGTNKLRLIELRNKHIYEHKMNTFFGDYEEVTDDVIDEFDTAVSEMLDVISIVQEQLFLTSPEMNLIFEGNQGILLDHEYGFFPHVTRANTMSRGVKRFIDARKVVPTIYYVTRAYSTRHGNGPFPGEEFEKNLLLHNMEGEANEYGEWQGHFRLAPFNDEMFNYALKLDSKLRNFHAVEKLVVTCMDHIPLKRLPIVMKTGLVFTQHPKDYFRGLNPRGTTYIHGSPTWSSDF